jgi:hypothetical protein
MRAVVLASRSEWTATCRPPEPDRGCCSVADVVLLVLTLVLFGLLASAVRGVERL